MSAKKASSRRPKPKVNTDAESGEQSAAGSRSAEVEVRRLIELFSPEHLRLVAGMRRSLQGRLPTAHEVVYEYRDCFVISYSPSQQGYEGVLAIRGSAEGVRLYFNRGKELPDPEKLLQGTGRQTRFISVESAAALGRPPIASFIEEAIARHRPPFAPEGRGSVVLRLASAKKGRRKNSS